LAEERYAVIKLSDAYFWEHYAYEFERIASQKQELPSRKLVTTLVKIHLPTKGQQSNLK
jgi:hypothetical protein